MKKYLSAAFLFAAITWIFSAYVAFKIHGSLLATVSSEELLKYGAIDGETLKAGEYWRLLTSQLLHSKQAHMTFNVILGWVLGSALEQRLGSASFTIIYWLGGTLGILASVAFYPEYVSSGSSQALMSLFAAVLVLRWKGAPTGRWIFSLAVIGLVAQLGLDIYINHFPKAGHIVGFLVGGILCFIFSFKKSPEPKLAAT